LYKFIIVLFLIFNLQAKESYNLGEGVQVGSLPLYLGGYLSLEYQKREHVKNYQVDEIAFLMYGTKEKFSYLLELEYNDLYTRTETKTENISSTESDTQLHLERVYLDYNYNENYKLRIGKYNSPVGFWNLLPINIFRDTSSSPISTEIIYPEFTTGLNLSYSSYKDSEIQIDVMLQQSEGLEEYYNNYNLDSHYALGFTYAKDYYTLKLNTGYFHKHESSATNRNLYYALISAKYETEDYKLLTEVGSQKSKEHFTTRYAAYIQGSYNFTYQHTAILRVESYENTSIDFQNDIAILGYTYRPLYPVAIKTEIQLHSNHDDSNFLCSLSVLF